MEKKNTIPFENGQVIVTITTAPAGRNGRHLVVKTEMNHPDLDCGLASPFVGGGGWGDGMSVFRGGLKPRRNKKKRR